MMSRDCTERLHEHRLQKLIERLPAAIRRVVGWLRRPARRWLRIPAGLAFVCGGAMGFLPLLGFWMLPLGLALLAEDFTPLWRLRGRVLAWIAQSRPHWFPNQPAQL